MIVVNSILFTDWHPLDHRPAPDYVPACWDGPHVGKRLVDGLRTLMLRPMSRGPQAFGNDWPKYAHDWADLLAQLRPKPSRSSGPTRSESHPGAAAALDPKRTLRI
jgi:hypothetical protein